ncbi:MAG: DUF2029 domain-containing protein [Acidobacteria bacterium]|nr:DUF2029 domain-containing protein [Acidobacteriota bacterium]
MKDRLAAGVLSLLALSLMLSYMWLRRDWWIEGGNDFAAFYSGAHLLGSGDLYDVAALHANEDRFLGDHAITHGYVRAPFHAALLWPLTRLPYLTAFYAFLAASVAAFVAFIALWPSPKLEARLPFCLMAIPVFDCFVTGQDTVFLLPVAAGALALFRREKPGAAGALLSLGAMKPHLFALIPVVLLARRDWRALRGFLAGGAGLAVVSFALEGWDWPQRMVRTALDPAFSPNPHLMPNFTALFLGAPGAEYWQVAATVAVAVGCWYVARRQSWEQAAACALLGGVLIGRHSYLADCTLWLPAAMTLLCRSRTAVMRFGALALLVPPTYFLGGAGRPTAEAAALAGLLILGQAWEASTAPAAEPEGLPLAAKTCSA